jgi:plastocyanin
VRRAGAAAVRRDPAYYNSGIIPYEGPGGNVFEFTLADDIEPGEYAFYCAVHGSWQSGVVEVLPEDEPLPSPRAVAATRTREQVTELIDPYENVFAQAVRQEYRFRGEQHSWNYAGLLLDVEEPDGIINEFVPADITTTVGEPVSWRLFGPHSVSFDVPEYFPIVEFRDDGEVTMNEAIYEAAGGAPPVPEEGTTTPPSRSSSMPAPTTVTGSGPRGCCGARATSSSRCASPNPASTPTPA